MKRAAAILFILILTLCISLPYAFASSGYELPELNMTVNIPDDFVVLTRDMPEDDPSFAALGTTKTDVDGKLVTNNEYLHAVKKDASEEIAISMAPDKSGIFDYNLLSESDVEKGVKEFIKTSQKDYPDAKIAGHSIYKQGQAIYICMDYALPAGGSDYWYRTYVTVINGMVIQLKLSSNNTITAEQQDMLRSVIDSIAYTEVLKKPFSISQYWWAIAVAGGVLIMALRISKVRKKKKAERDGNNAAK
jgi:hypothetical protein